jgi:hypothetical protein
MEQAKRYTYPFCVEVDKKSYQCERVVSSTAVLTQTVTVRGIGSEDDSAEYGPSALPVISMEGIATLIAIRIVRKSVPGSV